MNLKIDVDDLKYEDWPLFKLTNELRQRNAKVRPTGRRADLVEKWVTATIYLTIISLIVSEYVKFK